jgi:putative acetyltransferase
MAWTDLRIELDDPARADVRALLAAHLSFTTSQSPPEDMHALDVDGLTEPGLSFFSARGVEGRLVAVGALKELDSRHGELKSMHTAQAARGHGVARAMLAHLLLVASERGYERVSLETGSMDAFAPARALYAGAGFVVCEPFASYGPSPNSVFMTLVLRPAR